MDNKPLPGNFMLSVLSNLSNIIIPLIIFYIVAEGLLMKTNVYEHFIKGAKEGFLVVIRIMPTLIGLMAAVLVEVTCGSICFRYRRK